MKLNLKSMFGTTFGKLPDSLGIKFTVKGAGVRNSDGQIAVYNKETKEITLVPEDLSLGDFPSFAIPSKDVEVGDMIIQDNSIKFVTAKNTDGMINAINFKKGTEEVVLPAKTLFGYNAYAKVLSPFTDLFKGIGTDEAGTAFDEKTLILMSLMGDDDGSSDLKSMLPMLLMSGGLKL